MHLDILKIQSLIDHFKLRVRETIFSVYIPLKVHRTTLPHGLLFFKKRQKIYLPGWDVKKRNPQVGLL